MIKMFTRFLDCFDHIRKASIDVSIEFDITDSEKQIIAEIIFSVVYYIDTAK